MTIDCYLKAEDGEPRFTLLGRDPLAGALVMLWSAMRRTDPTESVDKIENAERISGEMAAWLIAHRGKDPAGVYTLAQGLAVMAELCGAVVTIEQKSLEPLAMGNYVHMVGVRAKR